MNRATAVSRAVLEMLHAAGVRDVVLAPGSRSAGLAVAASQLEKLGAMRLHVRIDEREAGFLALGLSKCDRSPVAVMVTSGTAVANLLPAIVEAHQSGLPLIALTADRPARVRGLGAPQTIHQAHFASPYVGAEVDVDAQVDDLDSVRMALRVALGTPVGVRPGPVHINVQFDMPLLPDVNELDWTPALSEDGDEVFRSQVTALTPSDEHSEYTHVPERGLMVLGDIADSGDARAACELAETLGWPVVWEPSSNGHTAKTALSHGPLLVGAMPTPDMVMTVGSVGLSRSVLALLKATPRHVTVHLASSGPDRPDPVASAVEVFDAIPAFVTTPDPLWLEQWKQADAAASAVIEDALRGQSLTGASASIVLWNHLSHEATLLVGASWPVRHIEAYANRRDGVRVLGNRGANGIDGLLSTAYGLALRASARTYALVGDVSFLYGAHGLLHGSERPANLTVVVLDNDGGGIFSQLEQGAPAFAPHFERVFGTPHGRDLWVVAESLGAPAVRVTSRDELQSALRRTDALPGLHVIVVTTATRNSEATQLRDLAARVVQAITAQS